MLQSICFRREVGEATQRDLRCSHLSSNETRRVAFPTISRCGDAENVNSDSESALLQAIAERFRVFKIGQGCGAAVSVESVMLNSGVMMVLEQ